MIIPPAPAAEPVDRLSAVLERFPARAHLHHAGPLGSVTHFATPADCGYLHVMREGRFSLTHPASPGVPARLDIDEPSVVVYPRPLPHALVHANVRGSQYTCARLAFDGGAAHPLARTLPPLIVLPLSRIEGLQPTLSLLFTETARSRCGQRLMADRLFEVMLLQVLRWLLDHPQDGPSRTGLFGGLAHPALCRTLVALHERPGEAWSIDAMARCAGLSRSVFASTFKAQVGDTPADYLAGWRMAIAQAALRRGDPVRQLAGELGYGSAAAFSRVFAQKVGQSPRAWLQGQAAGTALNA